jgi:hypothetical protein
VTGGFKFIATQPNPGFHVRNFVGDVHNAYTAQNGRRLPGNIAQAGKALRGLKRNEEAMRTLGKQAKPQRHGMLGKTIKLGDGTHKTTPTSPKKPPGPARSAPASSTRKSPSSSRPRARAPSVSAATPRASPASGAASSAPPSHAKTSPASRPTSRAASSA